jgi:hypothetical protein
MINDKNLKFLCIDQRQTRNIEDKQARETKLSS